MPSLQRHDDDAFDKEPRRRTQERERWVRPGHHKRFDRARHHLVLDFARQKFHAERQVARKDAANEQKGKIIAELANRRGLLPDEARQQSIEKDIQRAAKIRADKIEPITLGNQKTAKVNAQTLNQVFVVCRVA